MDTLILSLSSFSQVNNNVNNITVETRTITGATRVNHVFPVSLPVKCFKLLGDYKNGEPIQVNSSRRYQNVHQLGVASTLVPSDAYLTTYNVSLSSFRIDGKLDIIEAPIRIKQNIFKNFNYFQIVDIYLYDNADSINNLCVVIETQSPRRVTHLVFPYSKVGIDEPDEQVVVVAPQAEEDVIEALRRETTREFITTEKGILIRRE